jgi:hypothetical protein
MDKNILKRAKDFYAIYCSSSEGRSWDNRPCPPWAKLGDAVQRHWYTVAARSLQLQLGDTNADMLGEENEILPNTLAIGHLGDDVRVENAVRTWTEYSA